MKKVIAMILVICLAMAIGVGATLAYLTAQDSATNTFTVGNVKIDLTEPQWDASGKKDAPESYPGEALAKDPTVKNIGANPCFVRISVTGLDSLGGIIYRTDYVDNKLGTDWVYNEADGYFYYTKVLIAGQTTDALFDQIVIPADAENEDGVKEDGSVKNYDIVVNAYAVQAQGAKPSYSAVEKMTVAEIAAWFAVCAPADWQ